jgi:adenosylmethionine-8-amino-7-oxononanoate aminotransferase
MPLGGVVVGPRVQEPFWSGDGVAFKHGYTYSGHAAACAAALANLDILEEEDLVARVAAFEPEWAERVFSLADNPLVEEVRAIGLLGAVELSREELEARPGLLEQVVANARREGILTRSLPSAVHLSPAFVITEEQADLLMAGLSRALDTAREEDASPARPTPEWGGDDRLE